MKRILSLILSATIVISNLSFCTTAKAQEGPKRSSYTVFILGRRSTYYGCAWSYFNNQLDLYDQVNALERFISIVETKNRLEQANIAVVVSGLKEGTFIVEFSQNYRDIISKIKDKTFYPSEKRNISDGLSTANKLLEQVKDASAEKNAILFSSGWSNSGNVKNLGHYSTYSIGEKYTPPPSGYDAQSEKLNAYVNSAYDEAQKIKNQNANLYVIHGTRPLDTDEIEQSNKDHNNLQEYFAAVDLDLASNEKYFYAIPIWKFSDKGNGPGGYSDYNWCENVKNIKNPYSCWKEAIENIANKIAHNEDCPILIIPGIMGSRLFSGNSWNADIGKNFSEQMLVWPPNAEKLLILGDTLHNKNFRVRPCENQNIVCFECEKNSCLDKDKEGKSTVEQYGKEYGALDSYKDLVDKLCDKYPHYDHKRYREVYFFSYDWTLTLSSLDLINTIDNILYETGSKKIDIIAHSMGGLIASKYFSEYPQNRGKINNVITCGTPYEGAPEVFDVVLNGKITKEWKKDFIGAKVLGGLSKSIRAEFGSARDLTPSDNYLSKIPMQKIADDSLSETPMQRMLAGLMKKTLDLTVKEYEKTINNIFEGYYLYDIKIFQKSLHVSEDKDYNILLDYDKAYFGIGINQKTVKSVVFDLVFNPFTGSLCSVCIRDLNYENEGDGTVPYLSASMIDKIGDRCCRFETNHMGVIQNEDCIDWIIDILNNGSSEISSADFSHKPYMTINIEDEADIVIEKNGETLSSNPENPSFTTSFGRLDLLKTSEEGKYIKCLCIDSDTDYQLSFKTENDRPVQLSVQFFNGDGSLKDSKMLALDSANGSNICETFNDFIGQNIA